MPSKKQTNQNITYTQVDWSALDFIENELVYNKELLLYHVLLNDTPIGFMQYTLEENNTVLLLQNLEAVPRHKGYGHIIVHALPNLFPTVHQIKGYALSTAEAYYFWLHLGADFEDVMIPQTDEEFFTEQLNGVSYAFTLDINRLKPTTIKED